MYDGNYSLRLALMLLRALKRVGMKSISSSPVLETHHFQYFTKVDGDFMNVSFKSEEIFYELYENARQ